MGSTSDEAHLSSAVARVPDTRSQQHWETCSSLGRIGSRLHWVGQYDDAARITHAEVGQGPNNIFCGVNCVLFQKADEWYRVRALPLNCCRTSGRATYPRGLAGESRRSVEESAVVASSMSNTKR